MEGIVALTNDGLTNRIELHLHGALRATVGGQADILPTLRKARALFVVLALSEGQSATRRSLAGLLWSRNDPVQALARLRDTLSGLRQSLRESVGDPDLLRVVGDRVALRAGSVRVVLDTEAAPVQAALEIGADLDGIDPALDSWLLSVRGRLRASRPPAVVASSEPVRSSRRGAVVGVCIPHVIGPASDDELAFALAEEIATALSRIRGVIVVSGGRMGNRAEMRDLRHEAGLDFLLEGSLQRLGGRLRVAVKLLEAPGGVVCWSSHFDYDHDDAFHVQQDVAGLVSAGLEPELPIIAGERLRRSGVAADGAYVLVLRAIALTHLLDRRSFNEAGGLLTRAIEVEPEYSSAYSWLALWHVFLVGQGWARDARASIARAGEVAEHAVMLDPNDARGLAIAGHVRAFLHRRLDEALPLHERALAINPSLPLAWHLSGVAQAYQGNIEEARRRIEHCRRLAPRDPHSFFADGAAIIVELLSRQHEAAAIIGRRVTQLHPRFSAAYKPYLAALGHLGEDREALQIHRRLLQLEPDFSLRAFRATAPFARREHMEHYLTGLSLAGVQ